MCNHGDGNPTDLYAKLLLVIGQIRVPDSQIGKVFHVPRTSANARLVEVANYKENVNYVAVLFRLFFGKHIFRGKGSPWIENISFEAGFHVYSAKMAGERVSENFNVSFNSILVLSRQYIGQVIYY